MVPVVRDSSVREEDDLSDVVGIGGTGQAVADADVLSAVVIDEAAVRQFEEFEGVVHFQVVIQPAGGVMRLLFVDKLNGGVFDGQAGSCDFT